jgi:hypothetical protein
VATGVSRWASAQPNWKFTYQSGDWSGGTDAFIWSQELDDIFGPGSDVRGYVQNWQCSSPTNCGQKFYHTGGNYNLVYMIIDNDLTDGSSLAHEVVTHEFGHFFGLIDVGREPGSCGTPHTTLMAAGCSAFPTSDDAAAVNTIYPDP